MIHTKFNDFLNEAKRTPFTVPDIPNTKNYWHGGNLDGRDDIDHKMKRSKYGAGLYLTTNLSVAMKYSKGSRKLFLVSIEDGQDIEYAKIEIDKINDFIDQYVIGSKKKLVIERLTNFIKTGKVSASVFENILMNTEAIKATNLNYLKKFFVDNGIDYRIVDNAYGFHETMCVLYNMKKLKHYIQIKPNDDIYDIEL